MAAGGKRAGSGRKKGSSNKPKQDILNMIQAEYPNYHPVLAMAAVANDLEADEQLRFNANKEIAQYVAPKRKAVEVTGADGDAIKQELGILVKFG